MNEPERCPYCFRVANRHSRKTKARGYVLVRAIPPAVVVRRVA